MQLCATLTPFPCRPVPRCATVASCEWLLQGDRSRDAIVGQGSAATVRRQWELPLAGPLHRIADLLCVRPPLPNVKFRGTADSRPRNWPMSGIGTRQHSQAKSVRQLSVAVIRLPNKMLCTDSALTCCAFPRPAEPNGGHSRVEPRLSERPARGKRQPLERTAAQRSGPLRPRAARPNWCRHRGCRQVPQSRGTSRGTIGWRVDV
jgi:hypothetical protein